MRFRQIEVFFAVMTQGTVTAAAKNLNITQPSVTATLKQAEGELGFDLFVRQRGRLVPTLEARMLFDEVVRAHRSLETIEQLANRLKEGKSGHMRIAATPTLGLHVLPEAVARFSLKSEGYSFEVTTQHSGEILANLDERSGRYDLGFTFGARGYDGLAVRHIGSVPLMCLIPANWNDTGDGRFSPDLFRDFPVIATLEHEPVGAAAKALFVRYGVKPKIVANVHALQVAASLVKRRVGLAVLDALTIYSIFETPGAHQLAAYPIPDAKPLPVTAVFSEQRMLTETAEQFVKDFKAALSELDIPNA